MTAGEVVTVLSATTALVAAIGGAAASVIRAVNRLEAQVNSNQKDQLRYQQDLREVITRSGGVVPPDASLPERRPL